MELSQVIWWFSNPRLNFIETEIDHGVVKSVEDLVK